MAFTKDSGRQEFHTAVFTIDAADVPDTATNQVIDLPPGAIFISGDVVIDTSFTAATTMNVGLNTVAATTFAAAIAMDAVANTKTALSAYNPVINGVPAVTVTFNAVPLVGSARLRVTYLRMNRASYAA